MNILNVKGTKAWTVGRQCDMFLHEVSISDSTFNISVPLLIIDQDWDSVLRSLE